MTVWKHIFDTKATKKFYLNLTLNLDRAAFHLCPSMNASSVQLPCWIWVKWRNASQCECWLFGWVEGATDAAFWDFGLALLCGLPLRCTRSQLLVGFAYPGEMAPTPHASNGASASSLEMANSSQVGQNYRHGTWDTCQGVYPASSPTANPLSNQT